MTSACVLISLIVWDLLKLIPPYDADHWQAKLALTGRWTENFVLLHIFGFQAFKLAIYKEDTGILHM